MNELAHTLWREYTHSVADRMGLGSTTQPDGVALHTASGGEGLGISLTCQLRQLS